MWKRVAVVLCFLALRLSAEDSVAAKIAAATTAMGNDSFDVRETATVALRELIVSGHEKELQTALTQAALAATDAEVKTRINGILKLCEGGPIVNGLRAHLIVAPKSAEGHLQIASPFKKLPTITLRVTNVGNKTVQIADTAYPENCFATLDITRAQDGLKTRVPLKAFDDLYPLSDMTPSTRVFVTLGPGASHEFELDRVLKEGFLMVTLWRNNNAKTQALKDGFAALRTPGQYELSCSYSLEATRDGKPRTFAGGDQGRVQATPLWDGTVLKAETFVLDVAGEKTDPAKPAAPAAK